jgi:hypothetical protein
MKEEIILKHAFDNKSESLKYKIFNEFLVHIEIVVVFKKFTENIMN